MKIKKLSAKYNPIGVEIKNVDFDNVLTLFVGISGVGKTNILIAIENLTKIINGGSLSGFEWDVDFEINKKNYSWKGQFANDEINFLEELGDKKRKKEYVLNYEYLIENGKDIIKKEEDNTFFLGQKTVKLSKTNSALYLLREENILFEIYREFNKFNFIQADDYSGYSISIIRENLLEELGGNISPHYISEHYGSILHKLYLCQEYLPEIFNKFTSVYKEIFPYIENIKIEALEINIADDKYPNIKKLEIKIKELGVDYWVNYNNISAGMLKTLIHLAYIYFSSEGTVFLIDEFENGFGINCINSITDYVLNSKNDYQFIMTSHHPYIINNIPVQKWKIVNRVKNIITSETATSHIDTSNHDAFIKLINSNFYMKGINIEDNDEDWSEEDFEE